MPGLTRTQGWLPPPAGSARRRLFCLPYAGGSAHVYRSWPQALGDTDVVALQPPGRGSRYRDPLVTSIEPLVDSLLTDLAPHLDRPFAFFGHSMGAHLAHAATRRLAETGRPLPELLIVSAARPPHLIDRQGIHEQDDEALLGYLKSLGGLPAEALSSPDLLEVMLPILRADCAVDESCATPERTPLPVPIHALTGTGDASVTPAQAAAWAEFTSRTFALHPVPGGHFFLETAEPETLALVRALLGPRP